jgi:hypothetical protein
VRSRIARLIGLAGLLALLRRLRSRPAAVLEPAADPAAELRRKLDATQEEQPAAAPEPPVEGLDARRRQVHDAGRAAVDEMSGTTPAD